MNVQVKGFCGFGESARLEIRRYGVIGEIRSGKKNSSHVVGNLSTQWIVNRMHWYSHALGGALRHLLSVTYTIFL